MMASRTLKISSLWQSTMGAKSWVKVFKLYGALIFAMASMSALSAAKYPQRMPARPKAFDNVRRTMRFGYFPMRPMTLSFWANSMYASSTKTIFSAACKTSSIYAAGRRSPVGLFGLQMTVTFGWYFFTASRSPA